MTFNRFAANMLLLSASSSSTISYGSIYVDPPAEIIQKVEKTDLVIQAINRLSLKAELKDQLTHQLVQHPKREVTILRTSDGLDCVLFVNSMANDVKPQFLPNQLKLANTRAIGELILSKSSDDTLIELGLTDVAARKAALSSTVRDLRFSSNSAGISHLALKHDSVIVAVAFGQSDDIMQRLESKVSADILIEAYAKYVRDRYRPTLKAKKWKDANHDIELLRALKLATGVDLIAGSECQMNLGQKEKAFALLLLAMSDTSASSELLERIGNQFLKLGLPESENSAEKAFGLALLRLQSTPNP